jgi:hypothetical protein
MNKSFSFTCFGHYWLSSEGTADTVKEFFYICHLVMVNSGRNIQRQKLLVTPINQLHLMVRDVYYEDTWR